MVTANGKPLRNKLVGVYIQLGLKLVSTIIY